MTISHRILSRAVSGLLLTLAGIALSIPAFAAFDFSGQWSDRYHEDWPERIPGPDSMDLSGLPLNEAGRAKADSWNVSVQTLPERQCIPHMATYNLEGPANLKIWSEADPVSGHVVAWKIFGTFGRTTETIWMDGRPQPSPNALYTYEGFTTGEWEGDTLTTYTTHIKMGYLRRNGVPTSDRATVVSHIVRHGDILSITTIVEDPIYLTEPFIRSHSWVLDPKQEVLPAPCEPVTEVARPKGAVPHFLPGDNPFTGEVTRLYGIPLTAVRGGAETMYPEFRRKIKDQYVAPQQCVRYCCGWGGGGGNANNLGCIVGGSAGVP